ncbi:RNA recognition motif containing protein, polyadenylation factor subunit CstF64 [Histoplasma ohiense]|nr:RNA recognition motif containing protein, polyadenylation factor subunit CstF64 [Histoplasma ohiense (nom. inval.)]
MPPERFGKSVFLGNIPYNLTEEQVKDILSSAGTVTKFRLMINPETGKPKGYGFADFADADAAASAVRNLNDYEIMGRKIRVDWPHNNEKDSVPPDYPQQPQMGIMQGMQGMQGQDQSQASALPPLPPGTELPPNLTCPNAISQTLASLPAPQLLDVITQMKSLVMADPARATELLRQAPHLAYAIFQALLLMNLVDYSVLGSVVEHASQPQPPPPQPTPQIPQQFQPYPSIPGQISTPPVQHAAFAPSQTQPQTQQQPAPIPSQDELLQQVLNMPQSAIDALPPTERSQIMLLRQQLLQGGMR